MTATVPRKPEELQQVLHYEFKNPALLRIALVYDVPCAFSPATADLLVAGGLLQR